MTAKATTERQRYQALKEMLEDRRRDIQEKLRSLRENLPSQVAEVKDAEEQSVNDFVRDLELALVEMKSETLGKIDEAIQRLEDGTYGLCAHCEEEISSARLKALPFAILCISCQETEEERRAAERSQETRTSAFASPSRGEA